ncbi:hypothetical protein Avbf_09416 [Armadillidium vulgare]|nr:hypothetical protein Avbf_09416 [Armadillidium vulgare]
MCSFTEYQVDAGGKLCSYCGHVPVLHTELTVLKKPSNIIDYPRQENNSLEKILNEYLLHSKAITYQIQLTLTSTFDDMRCTLLRLLEKVKNLELKNSLDVIKFLNITSHNADGCGNSLEEGIPEVIPKRVCPCFYFTGLDLDFKILNN